MTPEERASGILAGGWKDRRDLELLVTAAIREAVKAEWERIDGLATAAKKLADHIRRSVNVGPLTRDPSREAKLWRALHEELAKYEANNPGPDSAAAIRERPL